jgi:hypothetical protein
MVMLAHSGMDMEWACGHVGPAVCRQCFDVQAARLRDAEAVCAVYGELQRRRIEGGSSRQAAMALDQQYDRYLAGKETDDGEEDKEKDGEEKG